MATRWLDTYFPDNVKEELLQKAPLTAVDDVADAAVSLLGNESANGAVLVVDGGEAARRGRRRS
jgi:hypothetical protein